MKYFFLLFFLDCKNALLLHLLPCLAKPTGKPQLSIATAQKNCVEYCTNIEEVNFTAKKSPFILILEEYANLEEEKEAIVQILAVCDSKKYICSSVIQALAIVYKYHWLFEVKYERSCHNSWMVIQKYFFDMTYKEETCSPAVNKILKKIK